MEKKNEPVGLGWTIGVLVIFALAVLVVVGGLAALLYLGTDALCVNFDPNNTTAVCRLVD